MIQAFVNGAASVAGQHAGKRLGGVFDEDTGDVHVFTVPELRRRLRAKRRALARVQEAREGASWGPLVLVGVAGLIVLAFGFEK